MILKVTRTSKESGDLKETQKYGGRRLNNKLKQVICIPAQLQIERQKWFETSLVLPYFVC